MPELAADTYQIPPFDLTKVWPHKDYPLIDVGVLELNRNPRNYFAEVEQAAFEPGNMPPALGASPDKVLQARLMSYPDAHRYRIGVNYAALPVNSVHCPVHTYHRDGNDDYSQAGDLLRLMDSDRKSQLINNIAQAMQHVPRLIQVRQIRQFLKLDPEYGARVAQSLGVNMDERTAEAA